VSAKPDRSADLRARVDELSAELARAERTTQALRAVGLALGATLDLDELLALILRKITEVLEADRATLYLLDEPRERLVSRIVIGDEERSIELPVGQGIAGHVAKTGKNLRVRDAYRDKRFRREWDDLTGYRTRSILAAPMKNHIGRTIGVIQVLNKRPPEGAPPRRGEGEFSAYDEELLAALATQAAVSIDNSRLFLSVIQKNMQLVDTKEQLERRVADLKLLFELESSMGRAATLEELARAIVKEAARACEAQAGGLLIDEEEAGVWLYFVDVTDQRKRGEPLPVKRVALKRGEGAIGWAMQHNQAVSCPGGSDGARGDDLERGDVCPDFETSARIAQIAERGLTSVAAVPLEGEDGAAVGAIALYNSRKPGGFSQDDRALLRLISANASTAVRLYWSRVARERTERLTSIGRLLSGVMHDMRTPLTVIGGYTQLMAQTDDPVARAEHAKLIQKQFDIIGAMQREVLEFARGERSILIRKVYLFSFFQDMERQIAQEIAGSGVKLVLEVEDRGVARFDEGKMTRVVHNLSRNAIEAMGERGGTLTIRAFREGRDLVLQFSDTGRGIPKEIQGRLFQSFVTSGKERGTGLGLAIVKKIVDEHGGSITVASTDRGATFTIRLPQGPEAQPSAPSNARA
jgi:signal transduction histidine kinase